MTVSLTARSRFRSPSSRQAAGVSHHTALAARPPLPRPRPRYRHALCLCCRCSPRWARHDRVGGACADGLAKSIAVLAGEESQTNLGFRVRAQPEKPAPLLRLSPQLSAAVPHRCTLIRIWRGCRLCVGRCWPWPSSAHGGPPSRWTWPLCSRCGRTASRLPAAAAALLSIGQIRLLVASQTWTANN